MTAQIRPESFPDKARQLVDVGRYLAERNWAPATGGNFSVRIDQSHCMITQSGCDKLQLCIDDLMICDLQGHMLDNNLQPSAELGLHNRLYNMDERIGAVLHTHSVDSTVLSRAAIGDILLEGYEMQKALSGNVSHDQTIHIAVLDNNQDITVLANQLQQRWQQGQINQPGFLVQGHGLYAWGKNLTEARRHVEAFEFLMACAWQVKLLERV